MYTCTGALETQSTVPWAGLGTDSPECSGRAPAMPLHEVMLLNSLELGVVLFSGEFRLSRGTTAFKDFLLGEFLEDNVDFLGRSHVGMENTLKLVQRVVAEMITAVTHVLQICKWFTWSAVRV